MPHYKIFRRLVPAANAASIVASVSHVVGIVVITRSIGFELLGVAALTYILAFVSSIPLGVVLLAMVVFFRVGLLLSLVMFLVFAPLTVVAFSIGLLEFKLGETPWQYLFFAIPSVLAAWYFSVYFNWKREKHV